VLLAEDNAVSQMVASMHLNKLGCTVDAVTNGGEALERLRTTDYDVVLMDCRMPEMDGFEATRRVRSPGSGVRNRLIPIIALTAGVTQDDRDRCISAGMDDYLAKPLSPETLICVIERLLRKTRTGS
jgi:CheY-like chemotaxis protein